MNDTVELNIPKSAAERIKPKLSIEEQMDTPASRKLADERCEFILFQMINKDLTLKAVIRLAYMRGISDAAQTIADTPT